MIHRPSVEPIRNHQHHTRGLASAGMGLGLLPVVAPCHPAAVLRALAVVQRGPATSVRLFN